MPVSDLDRRFMAAAIRLSRRHEGLTVSNPSVATLIVRDDGNGPIVVGRGITALGGRPHAEAEALSEAGAQAHGATAYVTLEPCAHHGRTPPCANALVTAGVARVVAAATDPDPRVSGLGYAILSNAGVEVEQGVLAGEAAETMAGYLTQRTKNRPHVTLKLAVSADGKIGLKGEGQVRITGDIARAQVHLLRARCHAILVGVETLIADDPDLTCRLDGLQSRSPVRIVLDSQLRTPAEARAVQSARDVPLLIATPADTASPKARQLAHAGVEFLAADDHDGRIALPELLDDLAARGIYSLMVEGGAQVAASFLAEGLVDRIALYRGPDMLGEGGIASPVTSDTVQEGFRLVREMTLGPDHYEEYEKQDAR